ncbi:hypothetical protein F4823DRAFT_639981 [Ustulina deusta]|nr:hypothetical protein F4823DRAFT_639981 [Ustulina deusta]
MALHLARTGAGINYVSSVSTMGEITTRAPDIMLRADIMKADVSKADETAASNTSKPRRFYAKGVPWSLRIQQAPQLPPVHQPRKYVEEGGRLFSTVSISTDWLNTGFLSILRTSTNMPWPGGTDVACRSRFVQGRDAENGRQLKRRNDALSSNDTTSKAVAKVRAESPPDCTGNVDNIANMVNLLSSPGAEWIAG